MLSLSLFFFSPPSPRPLFASFVFFQISHLPFHPTFPRASLTFKYYSRSKSYSLSLFSQPFVITLNLCSSSRYLNNICIVRTHEKSLRMPGVSSCSLSSAIITTPAVASPNTGFICRRTCLPSSRRRARPRWRQTAEKR